jgi:LemA protein
MTLVLIIAAAVVITVVTIVFNRLIRLRNASTTAWSDIDVQLKRRHDLVRNVVEVVRGYADFERTTLEQVTAARGRAVTALDSGDPARAGQAEGQLAGGVRRLFALAEAYPQLKASEHFLELQRTLVDLEDDIQNARRYYNAVVRDLNTRIQSFPDLLIARPLGFREGKFFELESPEEAGVPRAGWEERA